MTRALALKRNILLYRLIIMFSGGGIITPVIYFFLTLAKGLTPTQALFIIGLIFLASALTEIPTGVVADKVSRKYSIIIGCFVLILSWLGVIFGTGFWPILIFTIGRGVGSSFISGADEALLYDSLQETDQSKNFKSIYNASQSLELVFFACMVLVGGIIGSTNLYWPIVIHIIFLCLSIVFATLFVEPKTTKHGEEIEHTGYLTHAGKSIKTVFSRTGVYSGLLSAFAAFTLISAVFKSTKNIVSPILDSYGVAISGIGLTIAGILFIKAIGAFVSSKIKRKISPLKETAIALVFCVVGLLAITYTHLPIIKLIIFALIISLDYVIMTNLKATVNEKIPSSQRSTILSLLSLFSRSFEMLFLTSFGAIFDLFSMSFALLFTTAWLALAIVVLMIFHQVRANNKKRS